LNNITLLDKKNVLFFTDDILMYDKVLQTRLYRNSESIVYTTEDDIKTINSESKYILPKPYYLHTFSHTI